MAEEIVAGPVRDWLASNRSWLNTRFRTAQRQYPQLSADTVLALCRDLLPPLAAADAACNVELLASLFDLILLHAGRGKLAAQGGDPGLVALLRTTFPKLLPWLTQQPRHLPGALSNAVENLSDRGPEFAIALAGLAPFVQQPQELIDAGVVLAWRLGDARLRRAALQVTPQLPPQLCLAALGLPDWPPAAAALVIAGLHSHGWWRPEELWSEETIHRVADGNADHVSELVEMLRKPVANRSAKDARGQMGDFSGFNGHFEQPPLLLDDLGHGDIHRYWVKCGPESFRIDGDVFGWNCQATPDPGFLPSKVQGAAGWKPAPESTSVVVRDGFMAWTSADSFRVRVTGPKRTPL